MLQCMRCTLDFTVYPRLPGGECPNCGERQSASKQSVPRTEEKTEEPKAFAFDQNPVAKYFAILKAVLFNPTAFFKAEAASIVSAKSLAVPLVFAMVSDWIASLVNFIWSTLFGMAFDKKIVEWMSVQNQSGDGGDASSFIQNVAVYKSKAMEFLYGAGSVILAPFTALLKILVGAMIVHVAVKLFVRERPDRPHSWRATTAILAYATGPAVLSLIPGFGMLAAYILSFTVAVIGVREVYKTGSMRATVAVSFPSLVVLGFIFLIVTMLLIFGVSIYKMMGM